MTIKFRYKSVLGIKGKPKLFFRWVWSDMFVSSGQNSDWSFEPRETEMHVRATDVPKKQAWMYRIRILGLHICYDQSYEIKSPPWTILWFRILGIFSLENIFMFQTSHNSQLCIDSLRDVSAGATVVAPKFSDTLPLSQLGGGQILPTTAEVAPKFSPRLRPCIRFSCVS